MASRVAGRLWARLTVFSVLNGIVLGVGLSLLAARLVPFQFPGEGIVLARDFFNHKQPGDDSLRPMLEALRCYDNHLPIYETVFFERRTKFQYPLTSLLPLQLLRVLGLENDGRLYRLFTVASRFSVWVTLGLSLALFIRSNTRNLGTKAPLPVRIFAFAFPVVVSGLTFFPLMKAYALGQVQIFISALFCAGLYCWLTERYRSAGALVGLMTLLKPQYALFTIWFALRRKFGALCANVAVLALGGTAAVVVFGWQECLKYLEVLSFIAKRGEGYYPNLSVNGLLNRALLNGDNLDFSMHSFAPYHPFVYAATAATSALLIGLALWYPSGAGRRSKVEDFCTLAVTATVASPVAWEHHYGILFPIFALFAASGLPSRNLLWFAGAYLLVSHMWTPFQVLAGIPYLNALESIPLFGVLLLLVLLHRTGLQGASHRKVFFKQQAVAADPGI
jgi:alpha-1,2-mannosyltransferase